MEDLTDNEREEALRRWWRENWMWIIGGIALGLALLWGWQFWQTSRLERAQQDFEAYQSVIGSLQQDKLEDAAAQAKSLRERHPASSYADQADLVLASANVSARKLDEAGQHLRTVMETSKDAELRSIARSRLARVMLEQAKYDEALGLLDLKEAGAFAALYHELRGDAYAGKNDAAAARKEYDEALAPQNAQAGIDRAYVELKRDALPSAAAAPLSAGVGAAAPAGAPTGAPGQ